MNGGIFARLAIFCLAIILPVIGQAYHPLSGLDIALLEGSDRLELLQGMHLLDWVDDLSSF